VNITSDDKSQWETLDFEPLALQPLAINWKFGTVEYISDVTPQAKNGNN